MATMEKIEKRDFSEKDSKIDVNEITEDLAVLVAAFLIIRKFIMKAKN